MKRCALQLPVRRTLAALLVLAAGLGGGAGARAGASTAVPPSSPAVAAGCPAGSDGVTVVVDFGHFGGGVEVRCAPWPVASGKDALRKAGFTVEDSRNPRFAGGFLCRIEGLPSDGRCHGGGEPYWAYWRAPACQWTYSQVGYSTSTPAPGSVEGYAFGDGARPRHDPCPAPPSTTTTTPTTTRPEPSPAAPPPSGTGPGGSTSLDDAPGGTGVVGDRDDGVVPSTSTSAPGDDGTTTTESGGGGSSPAVDAVSGAASDSAQEVAIGAPGPDRSDGSGSPLPAVAAVAGLVGLLGAGAVLRRRRARA